MVSGNIRAAVIGKMIDSFLYSYVGGDYETAGNLLFSVSPMVGVKIPPPPPNDAIFLNDLYLWKKYCNTNMHAVNVAWNRLLKELGGSANPYKFDNALKEVPKKPKMELNRYGFGDDGE